ncbi:MAG: HPr kinase/phosphorylase [Methyloligellaceae bacterium]
MTASEAESRTIHATCIAQDDNAALLLGPSGCGKSDLALRCIYSHSFKHRFRLVSDDQVRLRVANGSLIASPPETISGKLEVRGVGIVDVDHCPEAAVKLAVRLKPSGQISRFPLEENQEFQSLDVRLPEIDLAPFESSAPIKLYLALKKFTSQV